MSGQTITEKILAKASGNKRVSPGELVNVKVHKFGTMDLLGPPTFENFRKFGITKVWDPEKIVVIFDHMVPPGDVRSAELKKTARTAVREYGIKYFYDDGRQGIGMQLFSEKGHVLPGTVVVYTDSHATTFGALGAFSAGIGVTDGAVVLATGELWLRIPESVRFNITGKLPDMVMSKDVILNIMGQMKWNGHLIYKALEFSGSTIEQMSVASRMTICNMVADMGAKSGIMAPDTKTIDYVKDKTNEPFEPLYSDSDAYYEEVFPIDVANLEPQVSCPHRMDIVKSVSEVEGTVIDQVVLGSCTNGRLEDLEIAARLLQGKKIHHNVRMYVFPASQEIYLKALEKDFIKTFIKADAIMCPPTCGPCAGRAMGVLASDEVALSTTNRNFEGRMGSPKSKIYLSSPATAAASAIKGEITDPRKI